MPTLRVPTRVVSCVLAVGLVGACGSDDGSAGLQASGAWARTSPMMAEAGVAYLVLSSDEAVSIVSVSAPADVAGRAELHETVPLEQTDDSMTDDSMTDDSMTGEAAMTMREVSSIDIPAGGEVALEPGGMHVMLFDLPDPLELGETFDLTFVTDTGEDLVVTVEVRDEAP